jgi:hypothetical protein
VLAVLAALPLATWAAKFTRFTFAALSSAGVTATTLDLDGRLNDNVSGTASITVTGSPATCKYAIEGRLSTGAWVTLGATDDCTGATDCYPSGEECPVFHWDSKPVDELRGRLIELTGGTTPTAAAEIKVVGR